MVNVDRLYNRMREITAEEFGMSADMFSESTVMREAPVSFDDLMMVELMFTIEEEFANCNFEFDNNKFLECKSFGDVLRLTLTYVEGKESALEADYKAQDANKAAYEKDDDGGTWLSDGVKPLPKRKPRVPRKPISKPRGVRERQVTVEEMVVGKSDPIRKVPSHESTNKKETKERHGRYHRREANGIKAEGEGVVQEDGSGRPVVGRDCRNESELATGRDEQHSLEN